MKARLGIDPQLIDDLERVLAPILEIDERVIERGTVFPHESIAVA